MTSPSSHCQSDDYKVSSKKMFQMFVVVGAFSIQSPFEIQSTSQSMEIWSEMKGGKQKSPEKPFLGHL